MQNEISGNLRKEGIGLDLVGWPITILVTTSGYQIQYLRVICSAS